MKKNKMIKLILVFTVSVFTLIGCEKEGERKLLDNGDLQSIILSEPTKTEDMFTAVSNENEIQYITSSIKNRMKKTSTDSFNDVPTGVDYYIKMILDYNKGEDEIYYIYNIKDKFFVEKPYVGVWRIPKTVYKNIESYMGGKLSILG